jgi:hypothetical protein
MYVNGYMYFHIPFIASKFDEKYRNRNEKVKISLHPALYNSVNLIVWKA